MNLVALPVLVPLVSGLLLLAVPTRTARHVLSMLAGAATLAASVGILSQAAAGNTLVSSLGGWPAPFGIVLVADGFSGVMVVLSAITGLATVSYAGGAADSRREGYGQPALLQFLFTGVNMSFLTGDLFNLFVAFEVMLIASYALLVLGGTRRQLREGFRYVVVNLLASAVFVTAAGLTYGILGTLNMAHLAERAAALGPDRTVTALALLLASVFATKTALFPLAFWLPASYPAPPPLISAYFGGMLTKVGVYALVRLLVTIFPQEPGVTHTIVLAAAGVTMVVGSLGAVAQVSWRRILSFSNVGQVGYLAFALGLFTPASLAALVYYVVHHVIVKFALFLVAGVAERLSGREDVRQGGWLERAPALAGAFGLLALGLIGLPPTSGFIGKFSLVRAGIDAATPLALVVTAIAVATSLLTLLAMLGVWRGFFWGTPVRARPAAVRAPIEMTGTTAVMVAVSLAVAVLAGPLFSLASSVAQELADPARYIAAVLP